MEAQKNRMRNERQNEENGGIQKFAKGGIAMVINSAAAEERSRSGAQPRFPY
jgi:hypothetical protein